MPRGSGHRGENHTWFSLRKVQTAGSRVSGVSQNPPIWRNSEATETRYPTLKNVWE
jgi:hypothetical protein